MRNEGEVESEEERCERELRNGLVVHLARHLREPEVKCGDKSDYRSTLNGVVEVRHNEVGVVVVHVNAKHREVDTGRSRHHEEEHERHGVEHRGLKGDRALVHRAYPVEHLNGGRDSYEEGNDREELSGEIRDARYEHVVSPHDESNRRDSHRGDNDHLVSEEWLT